MRAAFGPRLRDATASRGPLCLGIDPHPELLRAWGLSADADGLAAFCDVCVDAFAGFAAVKPQVAFFEAHGSAGYAVLERTVARLRAAGVLVLADVKRGDIGSTMTGYAEAWLADGPLAVDAVTASPFLGFGSLQPLLMLAAANQRGVFVLAATSNPEGARVQNATFDGRTVAQSIVDEAAAANRESSDPLGPVGVVVGATLPAVPDLSALGGPVLVPGLGTQGGRPEALDGLGGAPREAILPAVARDVLRAGPGLAAVRGAAERAREAVAHLRR